MKYLIPAAAILALAICGLTRREAPESRPVRVAAEQPCAVPAAPGMAEAGRDSKASSPLVDLPPAAGPVVPGPAAASAPSTPDMMEFLKARLDLSKAQEAPVAEALKLRSKELLELQEHYRKTGVFLPREYGERLARLKVTWYRRVDGVLDSDQHWTFGRLVDEGFFRPGTEFCADLMTMSVVR